jgi:hypothetical protein
MNVKLSIKSKLLVISAVLTVAGAAQAAWSLTSYFSIANLDSTAEGVRIYPSGGVAHNPASCPDTDYYEPRSGLTATQRESMERAILASFMAGRKIRLGINTSTCGPNGKPGYEVVRQDSAL